MRYDIGMTTFDEAEYAVEEADFLSNMHKIRYAVISIPTGFGVLPLSLVDDDQTVLEVVNVAQAVRDENHVLGDTGAAQGGVESGS